MTRDTYYGLEENRYDTWRRFVSYYYQIETIINLKPTNILEIGVGNKLVSRQLKGYGFDVTTCDIEVVLEPDVVGDVTNLPFSNSNFDVISCCEVLEHIPFEQFPQAIKEIHRVSKRYAVISFPYITFSIFAYFRLLPRTNSKFFFYRLFERSRTEHEFDGHHYWEMGKKGYGKQRISNIIESAGFRIVKEFTPFIHYHYFFVLEKKSYKQTKA